MRTEFFINILGMALATYVTRFTCIGLLEKVPRGLERFLKHVPTAILTALIAPALFTPRGYIEISLSNHYLLAGAVATLVAYNRHPPIAAMGAGIGMMLVLRFI